MKKALRKQNCFRRSTEGAGGSSKGARGSIVGQCRGAAGRNLK